MYSGLDVKKRKVMVKVKRADFRTWSLLNSIDCFWRIGARRVRCEIHWPLMKLHPRQSSVPRRLVDRSFESLTYVACDALIFCVCFQILFISLPDCWKRQAWGCSQINICGVCVLSLSTCTDNICNMFHQVRSISSDDVSELGFTLLIYIDIYIFSIHYHGSGVTRSFHFLSVWRIFFALRSTSLDTDAMYVWIYAEWHPRFYVNQSDVGSFSSNFAGYCMKLLG